MNYSSLALLTSAVVLLRFFQKYLNSWHHRHLPFPPGPTPYPLIGNLRDLPTTLSWLTYVKWGRQYGSDVVHASALGQHIVVVNSIKAAVELFEKRSHIHSDRPVITMIELIGWESNVAFMPVGDRWRKHRRMLQQHFRRDMSQNYHTIQMKKIHQLLQGLLSSPEDFREHIKTLAAAVIMATLYGYEVRPSNDPFVALSENAVNKLSESVFPGATAVNTFPILRYLPSWMPGAGFQRFAAESRQLTNEMREVPFDFVKRNMRDGVDSKSVVARLLAANQARGRDDEIAIQQVAAVAYGAGADTTVSALASFFLAMALYPDVQRKAQTEIDTVVGIHQLPEFKDRPSLPYVEALYREVMRWKPVLPLGLAHASSADDIYNGYFIPKGTTLFGNIWAMTRDESIYPDPERFNPDRFFTTDGKLNDDDTILAFGFGRRICVGRHTADASVWATIVSVLSTFNIAKARDATGKEIDIDPSYSDGMISHPEPFICSITPRSEAANSLVQATKMETYE
ncbi:O-methylsterigmatocystin oxidoreductase [Mycena sanguinolenta]|uniref:O-methylsterigmatocystin oxidoreductase n=1 Tax=Mycena sanguinolenta TaxID=230812 RepID=A0A8H6XSF5_9AGAR|nr:O-methylsterigmatocystin oxidoreductase [Mycena sanguinolenta]